MPPLFDRPHRTVTLSLALQGGGAHGAFTWGVLDALLEDGYIVFDAVSGTSAGALNALLLAQGLADGGPEGARAALQGFWHALADSVPAHFTSAAQDGSDAGLSPFMQLMLHWGHYLAPEQLNPFDLNPLRELLAERLDFERLRKHSPVKLFIAATHAMSGKLRLFRNAELSLEAALASTCLPQLHRAVEIDGEPYWDGGYAANPAVFPLFFEGRSADIMLVLLTPLAHRSRPQSAAEIRARSLEIAFSASFMREMRMFAHLRQHLPRHWLGLGLGGLERRLRRARFHLIEAADVLGELRADSKLAANLRFLERLKTLGRERAQAWLLMHREALGRRSTLDLDSLFY
ncbi:MAG TPA: patatin-like phospholipase family protein [Roseateles sp.]|nr:patatin-like phospholipase family protein [Roseateles sp.]